MNQTATSDVDLSIHSANKYLSQCRATVNQSCSFIFDQIGSTYRIIPIFQYSGKTKTIGPISLKKFPFPLDDTQLASRNEIRGEAEKNPGNSGTAICFQISHVCCLVWIHSSIASTPHRRSEAFHGSVKNTTFWSARDRIRQRGTNRKRDAGIVRINAPVRS